MRIQKELTFLKTSGKLGIFQLDSGQEIALPKEDLPKGIQVGQQFMLTLQPLHEAQLDRQELARTLLNQILANDSTTSENSSR